MRLPLQRQLPPHQNGPSTRRRTRLVALGLITGLGVSVGAYVVIAATGSESSEPVEPIYVTGSTFIPLVDLDPQQKAPRTPRARKPEAAPAAAAAPDVQPESSRRLVIPRLGVDSDIVAITAPGGTLTPPDDGQDVGWWSPGAKPGAETGSALLTGHTFSTGGAALQDLETLEVGDRIAVRTADGVISYRVQDVDIFSKGTIAAEAAELFSQSAPGRLVVITCEDFDGSVYLSNVVVTATPVGGSGVDF